MPLLPAMPLLPSKTSSFSVASQRFSSKATETSGDKTIFAALKHIVRSYPAKWPLPLPYMAAGIVSVLAVALNSWVALDLKRDTMENSEKHLTKDKKCEGNEYDYVVVGGGTAGMIVATRLANASSHIRVLLLEQGGEPSIFNEIPGVYHFLVAQPANTFSYRSVRQEHCCQNTDGQRAQTTRGKMLGGSSSMNFMMYVRGHREDFNGWAEDVQDDIWKYENVLPFFKRVEDYNGAYANDPNINHFHGKGGLLNIGTCNYMPGADDFLAAGVEKGYPIADYNGAEQEVFSKLDLTVQDGWRESTYRAFYRDTGKPGNLCIKKFAQVTKVNFGTALDDNRTPKAIGVTYLRHNITTTVTATREVVLSAGVFHSPKLLLLSGVGPAKDLEALHIPVVQDLPVGQNLQDHLCVTVGPFFKSPSFNVVKDLNLAAAKEFVTRGEGVLAGPASIAGTAFFQSPVAKPAYPDLQVIQFATTLTRDVQYLFSRIVGITLETYERWLHPYQYEGHDARFLLLLLGRAKSTGYLALSSTDPNADLIIDPKYLSHPEDREALFWGYKKIVDLFENTTVLNTPLFPTPVPGCEHEPFKTDSYYYCVVKYLTASFYHFTSTCAMGKVVDSRLRVMGVQGLRVMDASVMPRVPNANTQAATILIGEMGAEFLIQDLNKK